GRHHKRCPNGGTDRPQSGFAPILETRGITAATHWPIRHHGSVEHRRARGASPRDPSCPGGRLRNRRGLRLHFSRKENHSTVKSSRRSLRFLSEVVGIH